MDQPAIPTPVPTIDVPAPPEPDAWHRVTAPGGYEWWYFDAEDAAADTQVVAILLDGFVFHPGYLRAYARYRRRPTRVRPPVAGDFPCAYMAVYRRGRLLAQFMSQFPPGTLAASTSRLDVAVGPNAATVEDAGAIHLTLTGSPWHLTARGPQRPAGGRLAADLSFRPLVPHRPVERRFFSRAMSGADHHWVVADPLCDVSGSITLNDEVIAFRGRGYHDHNYGTGPVGPGLRRWVWGRVLLPDRALTFHLAEPRAPALPIEAHLVQADALDGPRVVPVVNAWAHWSGRSPVLLNYPKRILLDDVLVLDDPRVVDASPFYLRLTYAAVVRGTPVNARALCEVAYPHRLRWPVLGRMIEMSIHRVGKAEGRMKTRT